MSCPLVLSLRVSVVMQSSSPCIPPISESMRKILLREKNPKVLCWAIGPRPRDPPGELLLECCKGNQEVVVFPRRGDQKMG